MEDFKLIVVLMILCFELNVRGDDDALTACVKLMNPEYVDKMCCEVLERIDKFDDEIKECNTKGSSDKFMCADLECLLNKHSLLKGDKIDNDKAKAFLDGIITDYPKDKNVVERVKEECLDELYEQYGPDETCAAFKFYVCLYTNIMVECESWKDTKTCKEASDLAKKCKEYN